MTAYHQQVVQDNVISQSTSGAGHGLFAARQIELNNVILSVAQPLMVALDTPRLKDTCYHCFLFLEKSGSIKRNDKTQAKTLKACTGCNVARYCDKVCSIGVLVTFFHICVQSPRGLLRSQRGNCIPANVTSDMLRSGSIFDVPGKLSLLSG